MNFSSEHPKIVVIGSCSLDLILYTDKIPFCNETVIARHSENFFGGKGANQAVGTARLGANVHFVGCVGIDPLGQQIMRNLVNENVNVGFVYETDQEATGIAYVTSCKGDFSIVVDPASNKKLTEKQIDDAEKYIHSASLILLQLEIPMEIIEYTIAKAKGLGKMIGLYASPGAKLSDHLLDQVDFIVARSNELTVIFGEDKREEIFKKYLNKLFVRDETNSTIYFDGTEMKYFRNEHESMVYKMGMGDAFTSGFAIALCHKNTIEDCVKFGNLVSSKVSLGKGAQTALPYLKDLI
ncbi:ribokinase [Chryseobacterium turcicum]|uniref:Ribokinase n=1 Tax=Chryseobacterium turcicum TaxID=2898076 RepID=A0A9Q3V208_9FLAO|nr:ribokinase [Chryseobacterium turcicum]MCD1116446.1 ribokinase [Chryseobacterium turcicum]